ncbi:MAG TPA: disulfide bond formation protein B [Rhizomicrobium sp.]|nr:disulfide bond formation protein B [Rhizomicrobium sp.]
MTTPPFLRADRIAIAVGSGGALLVLGALGIQYIGGIAPCEMCHWQRWAHIAAAIVGILGGLSVKRESTARYLVWAAIAFVLLSGLIGAYQTGTEYHILPGPAACTGHRYVLGSNMPAPEVQCDVVTWSLFGLSMASYNALCSFLIAALGAFALTKGAAPTRQWQNHAA